MGNLASRATKNVGSSMNVTKPKIFPSDNGRISNMGRSFDMNSFIEIQDNDSNEFKRESRITVSPRETFYNTNAWCNRQGSIAEEIGSGISTDLQKKMSLCT